MKDAFRIIGHPSHNILIGEVQQRLSKRLITFPHCWIPLMMNIFYISCWIQDERIYKYY